MRDHATTTQQTLSTSLGHRHLRVLRAVCAYMGVFCAWSSPEAVQSIAEGAHAHAYVSRQGPREGAIDCVVKSLEEVHMTGEERARGRGNEGWRRAR